jgi:hypothetical protein
MSNSDSSTGVESTLAGTEVKGAKERAHAHMEIALRKALQKEMLGLITDEERAKAFRPHRSDPLLPKIFKWRAYHRLRGEGLPYEAPQKAEFSLLEQFDEACKQVLMTGTAPELPAELKALWEGEGGNSVADRLQWVTGNYQPSLLLEFCREVESVREQVKQLQKAKAPKFSYRPQTGLSDEEPIKPEDIEAKVTPFYGGYYRQYVCKWDPIQKQIVQEETDIHEFQVETDEALKKYHYELLIKRSEPIALELPYDAIPLVESLEPATHRLCRSESGTFYLVPKSPAEFAKDLPKTLNFDFVLTNLPENRLTDGPTDEPEVPSTTWDEETASFLNTLQRLPGASDTQKIKRIEAFVRKKFKYPADVNERDQMNSNCASTTDHFRALCEGGVADCYWSNLFAGALAQTLGIHHRLVAGRFVTKDPRFDFAALSGTGHAWGEWWNGQEWVRMEATPAKEKDDRQEEEEGESQEGDFGEAQAPEEEAQEELELEEIQGMYKDLLQQAGRIDQAPTPEVLFKEKEGISFQEWQKVERFIEAVNATPVLAEHSIDGRASTLGEQWRKLFDLLFKRRKVPRPAYRGPVRASEGDELYDPTMAVIDVLSGEEDPMGFKLPSLKTREHIDILAFEDDAIMDLTTSMTSAGVSGALPVEEQKKMILAGLYNLMKLNDRLHLDANRRAMCHPLTLRSHLQAFKGKETVELLHNPSKALDKKALARLFQALDQTQTGAGDLLGALQNYEASLKPETLQKIKDKKLLKVLTIVSDGEVANQAECVQIVAQLREKGIVVQGIGFGAQAQSIRVLCHDEAHKDSAVVIEDVRQASFTRHRLLVQHLRKL